LLFLIYSYDTQENTGEILLQQTFQRNKLLRDEWIQMPKYGSITMAINLKKNELGETFLGQLSSLSLFKKDSVAKNYLAD
jgi:transcriptional regulator of NAD metabolism